MIKLFDLSFKQAITKLDYDFDLGLAGRKLTYSERERIRQAAAERRRQADAEKQVKQKKEAAYKNALEIWIKNDKITRRYKGISKCAFDFPPEYWRALIHKQYAAYLLDGMER